MNKPVSTTKHDGSTCYNCPTCNKLLLSVKNCRQTGRKVNFCPDCGEKIDWEGIKIETYWPQ